MKKAAVGERLLVVMLLSGSSQKDKRDCRYFFDFLWYITNLVCIRRDTTDIRMVKKHDGDFGGSSNECLLNSVLCKFYLIKYFNKLFTKSNSLQSSQRLTACHK